MALDLNPLTWNRPIVDSQGRPTKEFQIKWGQLARAAGSITVLNPPGNPAMYLRGTDPIEWGQVKDSDLSLSDILTNDVSVDMHGFAPKLPDDPTLYLDGEGNWTEPAGGGGGGAGGGVARAVVQLSSNHTTTSNTWAEVTWGTELADDVNAWDSGAPKRLTVPSGYTMARISAQIAWDNVTGGVRYHNVIQYNSGGSAIRSAVLQIMEGFNEAGNSFISPWLPVSAGDYFILEVNPGSSSAILPASGFGAPSKFQIEVANGPADGMPAFFEAPAFDPQTNSAAHGGDLFIARLLIPERNFTLVSLSTWLRAFTGTGCYAGVYQAASGGALSGATKLGQSSSSAPSTGVVTTRVLTSPVPLLAGVPYWVGFCYIGGGTVTPAKMPSVPVRYFGETTTTLPATAPSSSAAMSDYFGVWGA